MLCYDVWYIVLSAYQHSSISSPCTAMGMQDVRFAILLYIFVCHLAHNAAPPVYIMFHAKRYCTHLSARYMYAVHIDVIRMGMAMQPQAWR